MANSSGEITRQHIPLKAGVQDEHRVPVPSAGIRTEAGRIWLPMVAWVLGLLALWQLGGTTAAQGYEVSIYTALPPMFWYCLLSSFALHVIVVARECFRRDPASIDQVAAISGVTGLIVNTLVVILLPYLHGYHAFRGDIGTHVSRSVEIATEWNIRSNMFYPATYALVQVVHAVTGLDVRDIWFLGAAGCYLVYVLLCLLVAKKVLSDKRSVLFAGLAAVIPLAGAYLRTMSPSSISVLLLPLVVYLYFNSKSKKSWGFNLLLVLLLILFPFIHPLTALMSILWLTILEVAIWVFVQNDDSKLSPAMTPSLILVITWFTWFSSFTLWNRSIKKVVNWLSGEFETQLGKVSNLVVRSGMSPMETVLLVLKQENGIIIYVSLALATLLIYLAVARKDHKQGFLHYLRPIYALLIVSLLAVVVALVGPFGDLDFYRFSRFLVPWTALIIASIPTVSALIGSRSKFLFGLLVTCALLAAAAGGVWALHPSSYVFLPNDQVPEQDFACMNWISQQGDERAIRGIWGTARLAQIVLGEAAAKSLPGAYYPIPEHFGYDRLSYAAEALEEPAYMLITEYDRASVLNVWTSVNKYTEEEFMWLETDPSIVLLYSNGSCKVWATRP